MVKIKREHKFVDVIKRKLKPLKSFTILFVLAWPVILYVLNKTIQLCCKMRVADIEMLGKIASWTIKFILQN